MIYRPLKELPYAELLERQETGRTCYMAMLAGRITATDQQRRELWQALIIYAIEITKRERDFLEGTPIQVVLKAAGVPHRGFRGRTYITANL